MATIDPITGQEIYSPSTIGGQVAMDTAMDAGVNSPLAFRMMEHLPGFAGSMMFSTMRGTNTLMRGGFMDNGSSTGVRGRLAARRMARHQILDPSTGLVSGRAPTQFIGGGRGGFTGRRAQRLMQDPNKAGFFKSARVNNATFRPRAFGRFHSVSVFGPEGYTPFGAARMAGKHSFVAGAATKRGIVVPEGQSALGPGLFSAMGAGRKIARLEAKAQTSARAARKIKVVDRNIKAMAAMNNPNLSAQMIDDIIAGAGSSSERAAARANLMASSLSGPMTRYYGGYFTGAQGRGLLQGVGELKDDFLKRAAGQGLMNEVAMGSSQAIKTFGVGLEKAGLSIAGKTAAETAELALKEGVIKTLGKGGAIKALGTAGGAKVLGARAAMLAIPGLNILGGAMMAYDLASMAGELVKSGINLAKDATKSMKGSIAKPLFGMGYRDTEAAATSRARGVMAIQNSQLNARSALGSEGAMMAAHFG